MNFKKLVLCLAALPMAVAVSAATVGESKAVETGWLIDSADYTGSLVIGDMTFGNGYNCVPVNQGDNNWFAAYGDPMKGYQKMTDQDQSHVGNLWKGPAEYSGIWWHEDFGADGGVYAIAVWRAPFNGSVRFSGRIHKADFQYSDGIIVEIANKKSRGVASTQIEKVTKTAAFTYVVDQTVSVVSGEMYFFGIHQNGNNSNDGTKVQIKAEFTKDAENPGSETTGTDIEPTHLVDEGFLIEVENYGGTTDPSTMIFNNGYCCVPGATQGDNSWFAAYGDPMGKYSKMTYVDDSGAGNHYIGTATWNSIWWREQFGPDGGDDAMAIWRAPFNGKVKFLGRVYKYDLPEQSDGMVISVVNKASREAVPTKVISKTVTSDFTFIVDKEVDVIAGEMYIFSVNQYGNSGYDQAVMNIKATFTKDAENPGTEVTGTDIEPTGYAEAKIFADGYMHMTDYTEELGYCKDSEHAYYAKAKTAYTAMSQSGKQSFNSHADYAAAKARLAAWAIANGDQIDATSLEIVAGAPVFELNRTTTDSTALIIVACVIAVASLSVLVVLKSVKRRKHN